MKKKHHDLIASSGFIGCGAVVADDRGYHILKSLSTEQKLVRSHSFLYLDVDNIVNLMPLF